MRYPIKILLQFFDGLFPLGGLSVEEGSLMRSPWLKWCGTRHFEVSSRLCLAPWCYRPPVLVLPRDNPPRRGNSARIYRTIVRPPYFRANVSWFGGTHSGPTLPQASTVKD
jgi:hypothetical protein